MFELQLADTILPSGKVIPGKCQQFETDKRGWGEKPCSFYESESMGRKKRGRKKSGIKVLVKQIGEDDGQLIVEVVKSGKRVKKGFTFLVSKIGEDNTIDEAFLRKRAKR